MCVCVAVAVAVFFCLFSGSDSECFKVCNFLYA